MSDKLTTERVNTVAARLLELSDAVRRHDMSQFTMRIPAEEDRDADLVLSEASRTMRRLRAHLSDGEAEIARLKAEVEGLRGAVSVLAWTCCEDCGGQGWVWGGGDENGPLEHPCQNCGGQGLVPPSNGKREIEQFMQEDVVVRALAAEHERQALAEKGRG